MVRIAGLIFPGCLLFLAGCATFPSEAVPKKYAEPPAAAYGFYHKVEKGQTLWRISRTYGVGIDELEAVNNMHSGMPIEIGQLILIPRKRAELSPAAAPVVTDSEDFIWPLKGRVIAPFGQSSGEMTAAGINIEPRASKDVVAARSGRVVFYGENVGIFGATVIIDHGDGLSTVYARLADIAVKAGDQVQQGVRIARAGQSNSFSRRIYLHFEVRKSHIAQNPYYYLP